MSCGVLNICREGVSFLHRQCVQCLTTFTKKLVLVLSLDTTEEFDSFFFTLSYQLFIHIGRIHPTHSPLLFSCQGPAGTHRLYLVALTSITRGLPMHTARGPRSPISAQPRGLQLLLEPRERSTGPQPTTVVPVPSHGPC